MRHNCNLCVKSYSRAQDLLRHKREKHVSQELTQRVQEVSQVPQRVQEVPQVPKRFPQVPQRVQEVPQVPKRFPQVPQRVQEVPHLPQVPHIAQKVRHNAQKVPQDQIFSLKHPFTANISGPTACGKSYFVKTLLQNCVTKIKPSPQRIIWLYKRWQPLYDVIKSTVYPSVEFKQGIPLDLDEDSFIDPGIRNLIVLDDLMSTASKDSRINELFTEGSHHRNLSVIVINQNLYYSKDPTQRRNCHYLVIFNNPVDKQQIMTLSRQMFPENPQHLIRHYKEAITKPFGFLLIDLKPTTPESLRLHTNLFEDDLIKGEQNSAFVHSSADSSERQACFDQAPVPSQCKNVRFKEDTSTDKTFSISKSWVVEQDKMISCEDCGVVFANIHDLQKHVKTWCPEKMEFDSSHNNINSEEDTSTDKTFSIPKSWAVEQDKMIICEDCGVVFENTHDLQKHVKIWCPEKIEFDSSPPKRIKLDEFEENKDEEQNVYEQFAEMSRDRNEEQWQEKVEKYQNEGLSESDAKEKATMKMRDSDLKVFVNNYYKLLSYWLQLRHGKLHTKIMNTIENFINEGVDRDRAIRLTLRKYKHFFEEYLDSLESENDDDENVETEEDTENEDSEDDDNELDNDNSP